MTQGVAYRQTGMKLKPEIEIIPASIDKSEKLKERKNLRVAAYCRVSTDHEEQLTSYRTQIDFYTKKINECPNWKMVRIFADEGLSATSTAKRKEFLEMMEMCKEGKIDMILTKSTSRFARNTLDTIQYVRMLKNIGVTVIFEKENINTSELSSEMILQLYAMFSQAESESISNNEKDGRRKGYQIGKVPMMYGSLLGYRKGPDGEPEIVPEEAEIVIDIYTRFLEGESVNSICNQLEKQGIKTIKGNSKWHQTTVRHILTNEKYKGDVLMQKTYIADIFSKKSMQNTGELPQYLIKNHHVPIIEPAVFDIVQYEISRRSNRQDLSYGGKLTKSKYSSKYALTDVLRCNECGSKYKRVTWTSLGEKQIVWRCTSRLDHGKKFCKKSPTISEEALHKAIVNALNVMLTTKTTIHELLKGSMAAILGANRSEMQVGTLSNEIAVLNNQIFEIVREEIEKRTDSKIIEEKCALLYEKIEGIKKELQKMQMQKQAVSTGNGRLREICEALDEIGTEFKEYNDIVTRRLISQIRVVSEKKIIITFCGCMDIEQIL